MYNRPVLGRRRLSKQALGRGIIALGLAAAIFAGCARGAIRNPQVSIPAVSGRIVTPSNSQPSFATLSPLTPQPSASGLPMSTQPVNSQPPAAAASTAAVTAGPEQLDLQPACLVGSWQVTDLNQTMERSYQQSGASLKLKGIEGRALYSFDANGTMMLSFQRLAATFTGQVEDRDVAVVQTIDGSGTARCQVDLVSRQIALSEFGGEGVLFTLDINGQRLAEGNLPVWRAFASSLEGQQTPAANQVEFARAAVTCQGDQMTIQAISPLSGQVVHLERAR